DTKYDLTVNVYLVDATHEYGPWIEGFEDGDTVRVEFDIAAKYYLTSFTFPGTGTIPEPATASLFAAGVAMLFARRRKRG
ncbi:MAG: PEP-CTERM sorting domain-containing protein, partial [Kiritimatiellaeota bacterium]|nr:PEP-CTERM sorting domain-containing protein [Kiritimatiellota bacterium]